MPGIDDFLNKKYVMISNENLDVYLEAMGVNCMLRTLAMAVTPVIQLTKSGDNYTFSSTMSFHQTTVTFKLGEEFEKRSSSGQVLRSVVTVEGCTMNESQTDGSGQIATIRRTFSKDQVRTVVNFGGIVARGVYKSLQ